MRASPTGRAVWVGGGALALGGLLALLDEGGAWARAWLDYSLLLGLGAGLNLWLARALGVEPRATLAAATAFLSRLAVGAALTALLPLYGYANSEVQRAGYVFYDAFVRDQQAWNLAASSSPLWSAFSGSYPGDQYGGLLALSAAVYRYLSPDLHRPLLVILLSAAMGGAGTLFLWKAARSWFNAPIAAAAAWIFALYPESVLLGGSQMREPFLLAGMAMAFYALTANLGREDRPGPWLATSAAFLLFFSPPLALAAGGFLLGLWLLDPDRPASWKQAGLFAALLLLGALLLISVLGQYPSLQGIRPWRVLWEWAQNNFGFQTYMLERSSGWVQKIFREVGARWHSLVVVVYGIAQPVLPAALVAPGQWIMRLVGVGRAAGWYALAPLLLYGLSAILRPGPNARRGQLVWMGLGVWTWILVSAYVAGGDQWDNPRYRTLFIPWQAVFASWAIWWARERRDPWLKRWLLVEAVFVLFFTEWYLSRYTRLIGRLNFWHMVAAILATSALIVVGGWLLDRRRERGRKPEGA